MARGLCLGKESAALRHQYQTATLELHHTSLYDLLIDLADVWPPR